MHGLLVFISLLGGMAAFGFIGLGDRARRHRAIATLLDAVLEDPPADGPDAGAPTHG